MSNQLWTRSYEHVHFLPSLFPILISPQCQKHTDQRYETVSMVILNSLFHRYRWNHSVMWIGLEIISILWMVWKMSTLYIMILYILDIGPVSLTIKVFIQLLYLSSKSIPDHLQYLVKLMSPICQFCTALKCKNGI